MEFDINSLVKGLFRTADIGRSRSSILNPLQWAMAIFMVGIVFCVFGHPPAWLLILFAVLLGLIVATFIGGFFYFMLKRPHSLRSEAHDFKMAELAQNRELGEFIQQRDREIKGGQYDEVPDANDLKVQVASHSEQKEGQEQQ